MRAGVTLFAPNGTLDGVTSWSDLKDATVATRLGETAATHVLLPAPQRLGDSLPFPSSPASRCLPKIISALMRALHACASHQNRAAQLFDPP